MAAEFAVTIVDEEETRCDGGPWGFLLDDFHDVELRVGGFLSFLEDAAWEDRSTLNCGIHGDEEFCCLKIHEAT